MDWNAFSEGSKATADFGKQWETAGQRAPAEPISGSADPGRW